MITTQCVQCGCYSPSELLVDALCEQCANSAEDRCVCEACRDEFSAEQLTTIGENYFCIDCAQEYTSCDHCGDAVEYTHVYACVCGNHAYCSSYCRSRSVCSCMEEEDEYEESGTPLIHAYHGRTRPDLWFHGSGPTFYGLELETAGYVRHAEAVDSLWELSHEERLYHMERDGSLGPSGIELVFQPRTLDSWRTFEQNLATIMQQVADNDGEADTDVNCGAHVHRSNHDITDEIAAKLIVFFAQNREKIEQVAGRRANGACQFGETYDKSELATIVEKVAAKEHCTTRYSAINFQNAETVEFRVFKGTLHTPTLLAYIEFCDAVVRYVQTVSLHNLLHEADTWSDFVSLAAGDAAYEHLWLRLKRKGLTNAE